MTKRQRFVSVLNRVIKEKRLSDAAGTLCVDCFVSLPERCIPDLPSLRFFASDVIDYLTQQNEDLKLNHPTAARYIAKWRKVWAPNTIVNEFEKEVVGQSSISRIDWPESEGPMTARQLAEKLLALPNPDLPVFHVNLLKDRVTLAYVPVVGLGEKEGRIFLFDPDVYHALKAVKENRN